MAELAAQTRLTTIYTGLLGPAAGLFRYASPADLTVHGKRDDIDFPELAAVTELAAPLLEESSTLWLDEVVDLGGRRDFQNSIVLVRAREAFQDMTRYEAFFRSVCSRGNGVIMHGTYWPQYLRCQPQLSKIRERLILESGPQTHGERRIEDEAFNIAVHMRVGDYAIWQDGAYCFTVDDYVEIMQGIQAASPTARLHLFTNEPVPRTVLDRSSASLLAGATVAQDFLNMARCDIVVGPPSTFGTWASYLGKAKRLILTADRIQAIKSGENPFQYVVEVDHPTFSYVPGVDGPI